MHEEPSATMAGELRHGMRLLVGCVIGSAVSIIGLSIYGLPFLAAPIAREYGVRPADVTTAASFLVAGLILAGPLMGRAADRLSARRILLFSAVGFSASLFAIAGLVGTLRQFYLAYFVLAVLGAGTSYAIYGRVVNARFDRAQGLALGVMMSGPGISAAVLPLVLPSVIGAYGWRGGYAFLGTLALLAVPTVLLLIRPRAMGQVSAGAVVGDLRDGLTVSEALRSRQFWCLAAAVLLASSVIIGTHLNMVAFLGERGVTGRSVAILASLFGAGSIAGRLVIGLALDRIHGPWVGGTLFLFTAGSMVIFQTADSWALLVVAALSLGMASGAEGDLAAYLANRYFGMKAFSEIYAWIYSLIAVGLASGPAFVGLSVRLTGSYDAWLIGSCAACLLAAALTASLGPYRERPTSKAA